MLLKFLTRTARDRRKKVTPRRMEAEHLEVRQLLSVAPGSPSDLTNYAHSYVVATAAGSSAATDAPVRLPARDVLNYLTSNGITTSGTLSKVLSKLTFDDTWSSMSPYETVRLLMNRGMIVGTYTDPDAVLSTLASRGFDPTYLRPDGMLTALYTARNGAMLNTTPVLAKQALETLFNGGDNNRILVLDALDTRDLLTLLDDTFTTTANDARRQIQAYTANNLTPEQSDSSNPAYLDNLFGAESINTTGSGSSLTMPQPLATLNRIKQQPAGARVIFTNNLHLVESFGARESYLNQFVDLYDSTGRQYNYFMLWADEWEKIIKARFTSFFSQYKTLVQQQMVSTGIWNSVNEALDMFVLDMEDKSFSYQALRGERRVDVLTNPTQTVWQEILNDARWPAMKQKLMAAGLTSNDLSLAVLPTWDLANRDPRIAIWNSVMEEHRAGYLNRAIYNVIKSYFPNVKFSNYGNYLHSQTLPIGDFTRMTDSYAAIGFLVGTGQADNFYGELGEIETNNPARPYINPTPLSEIKIRFADFTPIYQGSQIVGGTVDFTFFDKIDGLKAGQTVNVLNRGGNWLDLDYQGVYTIQSVSNPVVDSKQVTRIRVNITTTRNLPDQDLTARANSGNAAYVNAWQSYNAFVADVKLARSITATSSRDLYPWITAPDYREFRNGQDYQHWQESVFHLAMQGASEFLYWRYSYMGSDGPGNALASDVLQRIEDLVGFKNAKPRSFDYPEWGDGYVISGLEAGGKRVWRLTPNPDVPFTISTSTVNNTKLVTFQSGTEPAITLRHATLLDPALDPVQGANGPLGYWIVQSKPPNDQLVGTVDNALALVQTGLSQGTVTVSGASLGVRGQSLAFTLTPDAITAAETGGNFTYQIDWNNDGTVDETQTGLAGRQVSRTFTDLGVQRFRVTAIGPTGVVRTGTRDVTINTYALMPNAARGDLTDLVYGASAADETITVTSPATGQVRISTQLTGTAAAPTVIGPITGVTGRVIVFGGGGGDLIVADQLNISLEARGGDGNDTIVGGPADDFLYGDDGRDVLTSSIGNDSLYGGIGNDTLSSGDGIDLLSGDDGDDSLDSGSGNDVLMGRAGNDTLLGGSGFDFLMGDDGADLLDGGDDGDWLFGGTGNDILVGGAGDDRLRGEGGRNLSIGGTGRDIIEISGNDGDISIAGTTAFDTNRAALAAILAEWGSGRSYLERVLNLSGLGSPSRANGNTYLQLGSTIIDDGAVDNVLGSLLNADWQLLGIGDLLG